MMFWDIQLATGVRIGIVYARFREEALGLGLLVAARSGYHPQQLLVRSLGSSSLFDVESQVKKAALN